MLKSYKKAGTPDSGFSYMEVLLSVTLIAISLVPILNAFQGGVKGAAAGVAAEIDRLLIHEKMEEVLTDSFGNLKGETNGLGTDTAYSDNALITTSDGRQIKRLVYIADYDPANVNHFAGGDGKILFVRVKISGSQQKLETLINEF